MTNVVQIKKIIIFTGAAIFVVGSYSQLHWTRSTFRTTSGKIYTTTKRGRANLGDLHLTTRTGGRTIQMDSTIIPERLSTDHNPLIHKLPFIKFPLD